MASVVFCCPVRRHIAETSPVGMGASPGQFSTGQRLRFYTPGCTFYVPQRPDGCSVVRFVPVYAVYQLQLYTDTPIVLSSGHEVQVWRVVHFGVFGLSSPVDVM